MNMCVIYSIHIPIPYPPPLYTIYLYNLQNYAWLQFAQPFHQNTKANLETIYLINEITINMKTESLL